jgi:uncharacterized membrane protein HdeD (DUF308 family)
LKRHGGATEERTKPLEVKRKHERRKTMTNMSDVFSAGIEQVRKTWGWFLVLGIALIILGAVCVGTAQTATTVSILVLGWVLILSGIVWLVGAFQARYWGGVLLYLLNAIIRGVTGYLLLRHPDAGAAGVTMLLAALFIVGGAFRAVGAAIMQFPRWGWTVFAGAVSILLGIYLVANWSATSPYFIGLAIGIDLILDGGALVGFAGAIHSLPKAQDLRKAA